MTRLFVSLPVAAQQSDLQLASPNLMIKRSCERGLCLLAPLYSLCLCLQLANLFNSDVPGSGKFGISFVNSFSLARALARALAFVRFRPCTFRAFIWNRLKPLPSPEGQLSPLIGVLSFPISTRPGSSKGNRSDSSEPRLLLLHLYFPRLLHLMRLHRAQRLPRLAFTLCKMHNCACLRGLLVK